jgi:hypothetical protein
VALGLALRVVLFSGRGTRGLRWGLFWVGCGTCTGGLGVGMGFVPVLSGLRLGTASCCFRVVVRGACVGVCFGWDVGHGPEGLCFCMQGVMAGHCAEPCQEFLSSSSVFMRMSLVVPLGVFCGCAPCHCAVAAALLPMANCIEFRHGSNGAIPRP